MFGAHGLRSRMLGAGFGVWVWVWGVGCRVQSSGFGV